MNKKMPVLVNRTIIRSRLMERNVFFDAIDLINYLAVEQDITKIKTRLVEMNNEICIENGVLVKEIET